VELACELFGKPCFLADLRPGVFVEIPLEICSEELRVLVFEGDAETVASDDGVIGNDLQSVDGGG
jgi:hypothetical protein